MSSLLATPVSDWDSACAAIITNGNITTGLVGQYGNPMTEFNNFTWGITKEACYQFCGKDKIYQVFEWNDFANAFTNWLLPWLALTAQLPFEAKSPFGNFTSLFMAVGSPALITYSLTITILNRNWVRQIFESLLEQLKGLTDESEEFRQRLRDRLRDRLLAAQYLIQESQQVPMRASQVHGWLSSLVALDENHPWWMRVKKDLKNSRRGYTFSLFAQIGMAFLAYTFTIATALNSSPLGNSEGSQVLLTAGGGIWIWMIPVILGWIMCGTQAHPGSINDALNDETHPAFRMDERGKVVDSKVQYGICARSGLIPRPRSLLATTSVTPAEIGSDSINGIEILEETQVAGRGETSDAIERLDESGRIQKPDNVSSYEKNGTIGNTTMHNSASPKSHKSHLGDFTSSGYEILEVPTWLGFSIVGDEALEGPIFNYARLFTFREFSTTIRKAFVANIASLKADNSQKRNIFEVAESCKLDKPLLQAYTPWQEIDSTVWHHMLIAAGAAIFVQWGTTGPAIMMAYLTPTVGLGCRSGGYLIYGVGATVSWALVICSFLLSHMVSLRYQDIYMGRPPFVSREENGDPEDAGEYQDPGTFNLPSHRRTLWHSTLEFLAVATRVTGKFIAALNACWVVISAMLEFTGVYSSCWCEADADVFGNRGWVTLFATSQSFRTACLSSWVGGVIFSFAVCAVAYVGFLFGCKRSDIDEYE